MISAYGSRRILSAMFAMVLSLCTVGIMRAPVFSVGFASSKVDFDLDLPQQHETLETETESERFPDVKAFNQVALRMGKLESWKAKPLHSDAKDWIVTASRMLQQSCNVTQAQAIKSRLIEAGKAYCGERRNSSLYDISCFGLCTSRDAIPEFTFTHPDGHTYISPDNRLAYYPIPKVASSILRSTFIEMSRGQSEPNLAEDDKCVPPDVYVSQWGSVPCGAVSYAAVRDPLKRFASGYRELCDYERLKDKLRPWGHKVAVEMGQNPVCPSRPALPPTRSPVTSSRTSVAGTNGSTASSPTPAPSTPEYWNEAHVQLENVVKSMACNDWNEHLVPQSTMLRPALGAEDEPNAMKSLLGGGVNSNNNNNNNTKDNDGTKSCSELRGIRYLVPIHELEDLGRALNETFLTTPVKPLARMNVRGGWPAPEDVSQVLTEEGKKLWCLIHFEDYVRFADFFCPPAWCDQFQSIGMSQEQFEQVFRGQRGCVNRATSI
uniref:Uncharacterized protein n=1 Tax=Lotharella globosa TaxID=91324 RepID=A0A7S3YVV2_9EUKA|mmetsp:Transcript_3311/g.6530  ORF Transcript_3311/g.6530 Transcript_3311/m.6530 type:complete len:492 (+) Transcript_3311:167-1642(+)